MSSEFVTSEPSIYLPRVVVAHLNNRLGRTDRVYLGNKQHFAFRIHPQTPR